MSSTGQYDNLLRRCGWFAVAGSFLVGLYLFCSYRQLPSDRDSVSGGSVQLEWREPRDVAGLDWSLFQNRDGSISVDGGSLAKRLRLAGTFFDYGVEADSRRAVLDDLVGGEQHVVGEGDGVAGVVVVRIYGDRIVLRPGTGEEQQLWLGFAKPGGGSDTGDGEGEQGVGEAGFGLGSDGLFGGKQVGEHRWVFQRQALLDYYQELRDEPERLLQVFDSLKPVYDADRRIEGYRLGIEGEAEFFDAVGMVQGDVIRSVNSMKMTNRRRAEYFIKEFVADRCNVLILEIERDGAPVKAIYHVR
jgi:hypothetical protein